MTELLTLLATMLILLGLGVASTTHYIETNITTPNIIHDNITLNNTTSNPIVDNNTTNITTVKVLNQSDQGVINRFNEIASTPYDEVNYNCRNKSLDFANYLISNGATGVDYVQIVYKDGTYAHVFIEWNGLIYDATNNPPIYGADKEKYLKALEDLGFNGPIYSTEYTNQTKNYLSPSNPNNINQWNILNPSNSEIKLINTSIKI